MIKLRHIYPIIWLGIILIASLSPSNKIPHIKLFPNVDKVVHLTMYMILSFLLIPAFLKAKNYRRSFTFAFSISLFLGLLMEILQLVMKQGRTADLYDLIANCAGAILGIFFYMFLFKGKKAEKFFF